MNYEFFNSELFKAFLIVLIAISSYLAWLYRATTIKKMRTTLQKQVAEKTKELAEALEAEYFRKASSKLSLDNYIILNLPDNLKSMFVDILKGFEEYAKLKGYNISFSVDNSLPDKLAFKFTFRDNGSDNISRSIRSDIREYIEKVRQGDHFDKMPIVINELEHDLVSMTLRNRMSFLQHNYQLEKNAREYYENLLRQVTQSSHGFMSSPVINIQTGGVNQPRNVLANHSANVLQGEDITYENNATHSSVSTVTISNSFNKRKEQIAKLEELIKLIREEKNVSHEVKDSLVTNFDKVKEEISDEDQPNGSKIYRWLHNTKKLLEGVVLAHHTQEAAHWIFKAFNFY